LAYAFGAGLPRETWAKLTSEDVDGLLDLAAAFIPGQECDSYTFYRFYHQALAEVLRDRHCDAEQHRIIAEALIANVPEHDFLRADWYTCTFLARHAAEAGAGLLDSLILETNFLWAADPLQLLKVVAKVVSPEARVIAAWGRTFLRRFEEENCRTLLKRLEKQQNGRTLLRCLEKEKNDKQKP
jgi:hypothetical protein